MAPNTRLSIHEAARLPGPLKSPRPVLYTHTLCPYAQRVFLTLLLKEPLEFEVVHVDLSNKPRWFSSVNPCGLVPALTINGQTLLESLDICREVDRLVPSPPLTPDAPAARKRMEDLLQQTSGIVSAGLDVVSGTTSRHWGVGTQPSKSQQQRFEAACQHLTVALQESGGPFLVGAQPSLADVALMPFFERFRLCLQLTQGDDLARLGDGAVTGWLDHMARLPACKTSSPDGGLFAAALQQHRSLDFFDYDPYTATELHPHLKQYC